MLCRREPLQKNLEHVRRRGRKSESSAVKRSMKAHDVYLPKIDRKMSPIISCRRAVSDLLWRRGLLEAM